MAIPQAIARFPGVDDFRQASMTFSAHGISPSVCLMTTVPRSAYAAEFGTLEFTYGGVRIRFPNAAVVRGSAQFSQDGSRVTFAIQDRRWMWKYGTIDGGYNRRLPDGSIDAETKKTPQELAKLLLAAMIPGGEQGASISNLPNSARPEVHWEAVNPATELAALCDLLHCRIVLGLDNRVRIFRIGQGNTLPAGGTIISPGFGLESNAAPGAIHAVCAPILFQSKFELEAVGEDTDGTIKLIDDLSYRPGGGGGTWEAQYPLGMSDVNKTYQRDGVTLKTRDLALKTVYRWYRVKELVGGGFRQKDFNTDQPYNPTKLEHLLPLFGELVETVAQPDGTKKNRLAFVSGSFHLESGGTQATVMPAGSLYTGGFSLDGARGIVQFGEPLFIQSGTVFSPARLRLTCTHHAKTDGITIRHEVRRTGTNAKHVGALPLRHPEIERTIVNTYNGDTLANTVDNRADVQREANYYIDAQIDELGGTPSADAIYAGILAIQPDGAIQQISWSMGGGVGSITRASRNVEYSLHLPGYKERRRQEKQEAAEGRWEGTRNKGGGSFVFEGGRP